MEHRERRAVLYRMVMPEHVCPYGVKAKYALEQAGYVVEDNHLTTRDAVEAFKAKHGVATTPQTFIDGVRIGGHDDVVRFLSGHQSAAPKYSYLPVVVMFAGAFLIAFGIELQVPMGAEMFVMNGLAITMILLALQKLRDLESFTMSFIAYDVLAARYVPYAYLYPFAELFAGVTMLAGVWLLASIPVALVIGTIGAWSVFKAVYLDKRELTCACVGGNSTVPLGLVSFLENVVMIAMALYMVQFVAM